MIRALPFLLVLLSGCFGQVEATRPAPPADAAVYFVSDEGDGSVSAWCIEGDVAVSGGCGSRGEVDILSEAEETGRGWTCTGLGRLLVEVMCLPSGYTR